MTTDTGKPDTEPSPQWLAYISGDNEQIPVGERYRLDAAEAMIYRRFGISPSYYVRANEYPYARKLADMIAALVLDRSEWEDAAPARPVCPKCGTSGCLEDKALDW